MRAAQVIKMLIADEEDKLLMIPGPTPVQRQILDAIAVPTISHTSARIAEIVRFCQGGVRTLAGSEEGSVFLFGGSGTLAQEAAVVNLVGPGQRLLVVSNGFFGDRFVPIAEAHGISVDRVAAPWGVSVTPDQLDEVMSRGEFAAIAMTMVETSTGVLAPAEALARVAKRHGALVILDAVCALGGVPIAMDEWGVDIVLSGAQKALGVPPGLTILVASPQALQRRRSLGRVSTYYADLSNWEASMRDPQVYFSTHAVNQFYALRAGIDIIFSEGLENRFRRHADLGETFRAGMASLGFGLLTENRFLAPTMSVVGYPDGVDDDGFLPALSRRGVVAAGSLGEFKGLGARFGHMGNISESDVLRTVAAVEDALHENGLLERMGEGVAAAQRAAAGIGHEGETAIAVRGAGETATRAP